MDNRTWGLKQIKKEITVFRRGQKIVVIESSAKGGAHPKRDDVGYLDNLYLFPTNRFILMDAFFFGYKRDIKKNVARKAEKRRLIIDLGIKPKLLADITKNGVTRQFFSDLDSVCLTSVGYKTYTPKRAFTDYPLFIGPCGVWSKNSDAMTNRNVKAKIPYGNIAPFISFSNKKYSLKDCDNRELSAWLRTMNPVMTFMWSIFFKLGDFETNNSISRMAEIIWREINRYFDVSSNPGKAKYKFNNEFLSLSSNKKNHIIEQIRKLEALNSIALHGQDIAFLNKISSTDNRNSMQQLESLWKEFSMATLWAKRVVLSPSMKKAIIVLQSIFFRSIIMSKDIHSQLEMFSKYFQFLGINSNSNIYFFQDIQKDANNTSAALARIFDSTLVFRK